MAGLGRKVFNAGEVLSAANVQGYLQDQVVQVYSGTAARSSALGTAVSEGMTSYLTDSNELSVYTSNGTAAWSPVSMVQSDNAIINGAFDIWQRGTSFASGGYTADRWLVDYAGGAGTTSQQTFTPGTAPVAGYEGTYFLRKANTTGAQYSALLQRIENVRTFAGQIVTVSFWAKGSNPTGNFEANLIQNFGSGGSSDVPLTGQAFSVTGSWARYSFTFSVPSISGKTVGTGSYLFLSLYQAASNTSTSTLDLWGVQVEAGSVATPFRRNAPSLQGELAACQRYYQRTGTPGAGWMYAAIATARMNSSTSANAYYPMTVPLRTAPTAVDYSTLALSVSGSSQAVTGIALDNISSTNATIVVTCASGSYTTGQIVFLINNNSTSGYLGFSAEL